METFLKLFDLSVAPNAKDEQGKNIFYKDRLNDSSEYIYVGDHLAGASLGGTGGLGLGYSTHWIWSNIRTVN